MYLDYLVDVPKVKAKITFRSKGNARYVYYEYDRIYDPDKKYIVRSHRNEWCQVTLLGKAIIEDNGECKAGEYCTLYSGNDIEKIGTVVPAKEDDEFKLYVMNRVSNKTILVFFK